jgi:hypothetical protein
LMGLAAQAAARRGMTRILIAVHPRHASFYERAAGFKQFTPSRPHPSVQGSPAVGLELNLATLRVDTPHAWRRYFGMSFSPLALTTRPTPARSIQRLANLWQRLHVEESAPKESFEPRRRVVAVRAEGLGRKETRATPHRSTRLCG